MGRTGHAVHPEHAARHRLALALGDAARAIALRHFDPGGIAADEKADGSPVTIADRSIEEHVRAAVEREFPGDGVVGEEFGTRESSTGFAWVIDPIDGTRAFARGIPIFSTLIAVLEGQRAVAGYASMPAWGECVHAARGGGAWWVPAPGSPARPARVSDQRDLAHALVETVQPHGYFEIGDYPAFERLARAVWRTRGWNDAYAYILCATGRVDAAVDLGLKLWDVAPFSVIIEEAGGVLSDWRGDSSRIPTQRVLMSNPHLHGALQRVLRGE